eukprot:jgi/Mesen1/2993/ME000177S02272
MSTQAGSGAGSGAASPRWSEHSGPPHNLRVSVPGVVSSSGQASPSWSVYTDGGTMPSPVWKTEADEGKWAPPSEEVGGGPSSSKDGRKENRAVGTPDYLAPEILLGTGHDPCVDWWSVGVILFEFLTGIPPFNAPTPELIFENILNRSIPWPQIPDEMSPEAQDLVDKLLAAEPSERLGFRGAAEVKAHPFFENVKWDTLAREKAAFIPFLDHAHDTSYFQTRHITTSEDAGGADGDSSDYESSDDGSTLSNDTTYYRQQEAGDEPHDMKDFEEDSELAKLTFSNFSFKNLSQLASINYDLLERGRDSPGRDL